MGCNNDFNSENENENLQKTVIIGGTFNKLHQGHKDYIHLAFDYADKVYILLTSDKYAKICKSYEVVPYEHRKKCLENYINEINGLKPYHIFEMVSECFLIQFCIKNEITMAVIIPEYYSLFEKINRIREDEGKPPFLFLVKQRTKTLEGFDINSTLLNNLKYYERLSKVENIQNLVKL